jgi:hypothetical protein
MVSHILALGVIQAVRCILGLALGAFLLWRSFHIPVERMVRLETGDQLAFLIGGVGSIVLALARGLQGGLTLRMVLASRGHGSLPGIGTGRAARRLGIVLAIVDLISLWVFPLSTACGTYGLLVYRHPEALDFFEGIFSGVAAAPDPVEARG